MMPGNMEMPEMSDADCEKALRATGKEITKENVKATRETMANLGKQMKKQTIKTTEKYESITTPVLTEKDFSFEVPKGTVLNESMSDKAMEKD